MIGPSDHQLFQGRSTVDEKHDQGLTLPQMIDYDLCLSAPVRDTRYVHRLLRSQADLQNWQQNEEGESTPAGAPTARPAVQCLMNEVDDLAGLRSSIISSDVNSIKKMDAAEGAMLKASNDAKVDYARMLSELGYLPHGRLDKHGRQLD